MILGKIVLTNFGIYGGKNSIDLRPPSSDRPIILIGGLNGGGKTTLLDAIQLGFFGRNAACSNRGKLSYKDYLKSSIHRGADPKEGARIEIQFDRIVEGRPVSFSLVRSWRMSEAGIQEVVSVSKNDTPDALLSEHWEEYIESYLPSRLAHLFFFDGEQIKDLAESESASRILASAVQTLLGLDLVDKLDDDLTTLERRKKQSSLSFSDQARITELKVAVDAAASAAANAQQDAAHNRNKADALRKDLEALQTQFRAEGGELFLRREEIEKEKAALDANLSKAEDDLRAEYSGLAPLLLIRPLIESAEKRAELELEARHERIISQAESARDKQIIRDLRKLLPKEALQTVEEVLEKTRPNREKTKVSYLINPDEDFPEELRRLLTLVLPEAEFSLAKSFEETAALREQVARIDIQLSSVPDGDSLARLQREIHRIEAQIRECEAQQHILEDRLRHLSFDQRNKEAALKKSLDGMVDLLATSEQDSRILNRLPKVQETLRLFRLRVIEKHAGRLERLIFESFQQLLRKTDLVRRLRIDPESFVMDLIANDGTILPFDRLSAGERQLLATAMLWGLAKASGRPIPTVIDTPLGRLDSSHRAHLVQRYFPVASHQVILLSTDEEIDERYLEIMRPFVGRNYRLEFDVAAQSATVTNGYFFEHETTS